MSTETTKDSNGLRMTWIECDHCDREQPEAGNFRTRKEADIGAKRHGWKLRLKRPEGYLDYCPGCYADEDKWRFVLMCMGYDPHKALDKGDLTG